jgi:hypothetical protein
METEVLMKREIFGQEITQKSKTEFFSATDLVRAGNMWRLSKGFSAFSMSSWLQQKNVKEFISELEKKFGKVLVSGRGRGNHTWVHPYLFIDLALAISPELKIEVYEWIYDKLIEYRNDSGDSYKKMAGALYMLISNKSEFKKTLMIYALEVKNACRVYDWQQATEEQLKLRDKIHENVYLLSDVIKDRRLLIKTAVDKALK